MMILMVDEAAAVTDFVSSRYVHASSTEAQIECFLPLNLVDKCSLLLDNIDAIAVAAIPVAAAADAAAILRGDAQLDPRSYGKPVINKFPNIFSMNYQ